LMLHIAILPNTNRAIGTPTGQDPRNTEGHCRDF
jgi:hypothetical protein